MKVLIADDLEAHEFIRDILKISFRNVSIDRVLSPSNLCAKIQDADPQYDLLLYSWKMEDEQNNSLLLKICSDFPQISKKIVVFSDSKPQSVPSELGSIPFIVKPYSLDQFSEIVKKASLNN